MHRSILLRLIPTDRSSGRLAGVAEEVETGERTSFRDADDLIAALRRLHASRPGEPGTPASCSPERAPDG